MHGRLKVKSTTAQAATKLKEREGKKQKYQIAMNAMINMRKSKSCDQHALDLTTKLLQVNPDSNTIWNYRREILNGMEKEKVDNFEQILTKELSVTEMCLLNNHKSYGTWDHRGWVLHKICEPSWVEELDMCDKYLKEDARNFHCWDHRRIVVRLSKHSFNKELQFTQNLIDGNLSNYSAWHYRSQLLPVVHPAIDSSSLPIDEKIFLRELKNVVSAVFTDPSDQSPWFFLRWLLEKHSQPKLVHVGGLQLEGKCHLTLVLSRSTSLSQLKNILDIETFCMDDFKPLDNQECIWVKEICESSELSVNIRYRGFTTPYLILSNKRLLRPMYVSQLNNVLQDGASLDVLRDIRDNCLLLEEIDPHNKWVLLSLVDFLKAIDSNAHLSEITAYLDKLQLIDPLRKNYYADAKSKIIIERTMHSYLKQDKTVFNLRDKNLTKLYHPHLLAFAEIIDLSGNSLDSCRWSKYLLSVKELTLDGNPIVNFDPLSCMKNLRILSLVNCNLNAYVKLELLKRLPSNVQLRV